MRSIAVIGAGAWGTALACAAARAGRKVTLWGRAAAAMDRIATSRAPPHLPGVTLDAAIRATSDLGAALRADAVLLAVPAQQLRDAAQRLAPHLAAHKPVVICAKGIERGTDYFMSEILGEVLPQAIPAVLSGPSFAHDVARGLPTAITLACADETLAIELVHALGSATFRPYHSTDLRGVEIGGAAKNVLAIAAGIVAGRGLGASALAALTTRGFSELARFGRAFGARGETLAGLSGLGDLLLTCASPQSRNFALGLALGRGEPAPEALAEGRWTAPVLAELARTKDVEMPVAEAVAAVLDGQSTIDAAIEGLLTRPFKSEAS